MFKPSNKKSFSVSANPRSSVFIRGKRFFIFFVLLSAVALGLTSCFGISRDLGMEEVPDVQQREGVTGSPSNPTPLDPFKKYDLVMAANECRYFSMLVPSQWSWKFTLTVANRDDMKKGRLEAQIDPAKTPWAPIQGAYMQKHFELGREGLQALMGVGNPGENQTAYFHLCQEGAPLHITIQSQISATKALLGPGDIRTPVPGDN